MITAGTPILDFFDSLEGVYGFIRFPRVPEKVGYPGLRSVTPLAYFYLCSDPMIWLKEITNNLPTQNSIEPFY